MGKCGVVDRARGEIPTRPNDVFIWSKKIFSRHEFWWEYLGFSVLMFKLVKRMLKIICSISCKHGVKLL